MAFSSRSKRGSALLAVQATRAPVAKKSRLIALFDVRFAFQACVLEPRVPGHQ